MTSNIKANTTTTTTTTAAPNHRGEILSILNALIATGDYTRQVSTHHDDIYGGILRTHHLRGERCIAILDALAIHRELTAAMAPASNSTPSQQL